MITEPTEIKDARIQGRTDYLLGIKENPYPEGTAENDHWERAWLMNEKHDSNEY